MKARFLIAWIVVILMVGLMSHMIGPNTDEWVDGDGPAIATVVSAHAAPSIHRLPSE
ncbi:MAG: hypothetical protein U0822_16640 [Anaerolineae bacterium]